MRQSKGLLFLTAATAFIMFASVLISYSSSGRLKPAAASFEGCMKSKGSLVQESYPEVCVTRDGQRFTRELSEEERLQLELGEDVDTSLRCAYYSRYDEETRACATCGDGACEPYESCVASTITDELTTNDCGPLYCPQDCEEE